MVFNRFVEVGRAVLITYGPDAGKLAVIVDIIDHNRAIVESPETGVARQELSFRRMALTGLKLKTLARGARSKYVAKAIKKEDLVKQWEASSWSKKLSQRKKRAELSDFDRFKVMIGRKQRRTVIAKEFSKLKKATKI